MGFLGESAPPASCLGVPIEAGTRSPPEFLGSRWPNPKREFLSFYSSLAHTLPPQMGVTLLGSCARRCAPVLPQFNSASQEVFP